MPQWAWVLVHYATVAWACHHTVAWA